MQAPECKSSFVISLCLGVNFINVHARVFCTKFWRQSQNITRAKDVCTKKASQKHCMMKLTVGLNTPLIPQEVTLSPTIYLKFLFAHRLRSFFGVQGFVKSPHCLEKKLRVLSNNFVREIHNLGEIEQQVFCQKAARRQFFTCLKTFC